MPQRLFLDANVLFTATISPEGVSHGLFDLAKDGACALLGSPFGVEEASRNIRVKYPTRGGALSGLIGQLELVGEASAELVQWAEELLPPKDAPILAAAVAAEADALVTGDRRHFGELFGQTIGGVAVLTPRQALERVLGS